MGQRARTAQECKITDSNMNEQHVIPLAAVATELWGRSSLPVSSLRLHFTETVVAKWLLHSKVAR